MKPRTHTTGGVSTFAPALSLPAMENLEARLLLEAAPTFATPLADVYMLPDLLGKAVTLGIDGYDADGDALSITVASDDPRLIVQTRTGQQTYARLNFQDGANQPVGSVIVQLFPDVAPLAVQRFINLATRRIVSGEWADVDETHPAFYTNVNVHRVIPNFMIQTGDAVSGTGTGGTGLNPNKPNGEPAKFADELDARLSFFGPGVLAMANSGPDTNDSQFFITTYAAAHLNGKHTIFGQVISGQEVADLISQARRNSSNKPYDDIDLASVEIITDNRQDATATAWALAGFDGQATLTVRMEDATGNVVTREVLVRRQTGWGDRPDITGLPSTVHALPGRTEELRFAVADDDGPAAVLDVNAGTDVAGVTVEAIPSFANAYILRYTLSADYDGPDVIPVLVTATEHDLAGVGNLPAKIGLLYLTPWGRRPVIDGVADDEALQVERGQTVTKTVTITDDTHAWDDLTVTATENSSVAGATVTVAKGEEPDSFVITVTAPTTYLVNKEYFNGFNVTVTAKEDASVSGITLSGTSKTFHVTTLGAHPTIAGVDDRVVLAPGEKRDIVLAITDDSERELNVTLASAINGTGADEQVLYVDSRSEGEQTIYTLHIDLTRKLPATFNGFFKGTISAVETVETPPAGTVINDRPQPATRDFEIVVQEQGDPALTDVVRSEQAAKTAVVDGQRLYVGTAAGLDIYSLADPDHPALLGSYKTDNEVRDIVLDGDVAYVGVYGSYFWGYVSAKGQVLALNVSDPANVVKLDTVKTDSLVCDLELAGERLYVAGWTGGLLMYDVSDPSAIAELADFTTDATRRGLTQAAALTIDGTIAYVADSGGPLGRLVVLDVSDPHQVRFVRHLYTSSTSYLGRVRQVMPGQPSGLALAGDRLYVSDQANGLFVYDVTRRDVPRLIERESWRSAGVRAHGDTVLLAFGSYHMFLDATDPRGLEQAYALYSPGGAGPAAMTATHAYMPSAAEGVAVIRAEELYRCVSIDTWRTLRAEDGSSVTVKIAGGGRARVLRSADGRVERIDVTGTGARSVVYLLGANGAVIGDLAIHGPVGALVMPTVTLGGDLLIEGQPRAVMLGAVGDGDAPAEQTIRIEDNDEERPNAGFVLSARRIADARIESDFPIRALIAVDWLDDEGDGEPASVDTLTAPAVGVLRITGARNVPGNFQAGLVLGTDASTPATMVLTVAVIAGALTDAAWDLDGAARTILLGSSQAWELDADGRVALLRAGSLAAAGVSALSIGRMLITGDMDGATVTLTQTAGPIARQLALGYLNVRGRIRNSRILARGRVGTVVAGGMEASDLYAGYVGAPEFVTGLPTAEQLADEALFDRRGSLGIVIIRGIRAGAGYADSFIDSAIAGWTVRGALLAYAALDDSPMAEQFGLAAHSLYRYVYRDADPTHLTVWTPARLAPPPDIDNLVVRLI